jgi:uncharacterized protein with PIN domain
MKSSVSRDKLCPGCNWKIKAGEEKMIEVKVSNGDASKINRKTLICSDCYLDYVPNVHLTS